ncbi:hypothetical protein BCR34DRAFT_570680 [Clohesyomyces aquaticus]|uniref:Mitochondrial intermembrane space import and assembly protein 40 n=1 Tax=Clohesyomyces aquaticus TaxID=1231657 RepID=A0A1Y1ZAU7_9PLEO|nr:hypothetical protein BCR34DRAFT_570680 [Clohesyomyces aquaticus]
MFRPASRLIARAPAVRALPRPNTLPTRRFLSTAPPSQKSRSWKSSAARWGAAAAIIYYYNTMDLFAEEPEQVYTTQHIPETNDEDEQLPTIDALAQERAKRKADAAAAAKQKELRDASGQEHEPGVSGSGGVEDLEEEAGQQGAFNPETGEINWDCPCLGGMATGPCGEQFKAAFSCFVFSTEDPKGMDCIDKFKDMQNCFREYPEIYGSELDIDEEDDVTQDGEQPQPALARDGAAESTSTPEAMDSSSSSAPQPRPDKVAEQKPGQTPPPPSEREAKKERADAATEQVKKEHEPLSESDEAVPKA